MINYYHPFEFLEEDEIYGMIVENGFADSIEEVKAKFPEPSEIEDKKVLEIFEDYIIDGFRVSHHDLF